MRNNKFRIVVSTLIASIFIIIGCVAIIFMGKSIIDEKDEQIASLEEEIHNNKMEVYVAMEDIAAGAELIDGENVKKQIVLAGFEPECYIQNLEPGNMALINIGELQPIMSGMISEIELDMDTRDYQIAIANLMTDQHEGDFIDMRIMFPNGEDYIVLAKKSIHNLNYEGCSFNVYLDEDEILRVASATIDAYTIGGTYIYTTRYIAPAGQETSVPNYTVKPEVMDLINKDPNIIEKAKGTLNAAARTDLERRLGLLSEDFIDAVAEGHNSAIANSNAYLKKEESEKANESVDYSEYYQED